MGLIMRLSMRRLRLLRRLGAGRRWRTHLNMLRRSRCPHLDMRRLRRRRRMHLHAGRLTRFHAGLRMHLDTRL
jgi:hypothetical protein